jgi:hypothetical protein
MAFGGPDLKGVLGQIAGICFVSGQTDSKFEKGLVMSSHYFFKIVVHSALFPGRYF